MLLTILSMPRRRWPSYHCNLGLLPETDFEYIQSPTVFAEGKLFWAPESTINKAIPPGPPLRYPFLHHCPELVLQTWSRTYGPLFSVWMGNQLFVGDHVVPAWFM